MAYPIINNIIPGLPKQAFRNGVGNYEGVVAHSTGSFAPDENQVKYFQNNWQSRQAFVQFFVDWDSIRQTSDLNYRAWGAGPTANQRYVHVELCQTHDHAQFLESYKRYVWVLAWILKRKNLGVFDGKTLVSHDYCSKTFRDTTHTDPIGYLKEHGKTWANLVADVNAEYSKIDTNGNYLSTAKTESVEKCKIQLNGIKLPITGFLKAGVSYIPVRAIAESAGGNVYWNQATKQVKVNDHDLDEHIIDGVSYAPARELAAALNLSVDWDQPNKTVKLSQA
ncbi:N-acetylmuramoyl-L-alanine amidase [Brevibacillus fulvus]|uniref:N-acetylmuramoyl-L-alanine amidase CwlA n=1 Tax=Brevibacillus fulvus TaxID=1125967 RepID=A0A938Y5D2_9BACL|nr:N-acetylmuramoyl-L-alanine amidase [Brevibacillus fulvus]MBM7592236.1 N-acetylmuramoyl-L-alanine amidase CwlA [Brevibacillus fulvus]